MANDKNITFLIYLMLNSYLTIFDNNGSKILEKTNFEMTISISKFLKNLKSEQNFTFNINKEKSDPNHSLEGTAYYEISHENNKYELKSEIKRKSHNDDYLSEAEYHLIETLTLIDKEKLTLIDYSNDLTWRPNSDDTNEWDYYYIKFYHKDPLQRLYLKNIEQHFK